MCSHNVLESGTYMWSSCQRSPSRLVDHWGSALSERCASAVGSDCRLEMMSAWSLSVSMIGEPQRDGNQRVDVQRDDASCSFVNTDWRFCRLMLA